MAVLMQTKSKRREVLLDSEGGGRKLETKFLTRCLAKIGNKSLTLMCQTHTTFSLQPFGVSATTLPTLQMRKRRQRELW